MFPSLRAQRGNLDNRCIAAPAFMLTRNAGVVISLVLLTSFFLLSSQANAQEKVCTQMGCTNGLILRTDPTMFNDKGQYEFQFFAGLNNQISVTCRGELPLKPCDQGPSMVCSSRQVMITEQGCALPKDQQHFGDIYLYGTPRKVIMAVKHNGKMGMVRTVRPTYVFTRPNGPGCDPECVTSSVDLSKNERKD